MFCLKSTNAFGNVCFSGVTTSGEKKVNFSLVELKLEKSA